MGSQRFVSRRLPFPHHSEPADNGLAAELVDLAVVLAGQLVDELHPPWALVAREAVAAQGHELLWVVALESCAAGRLRRSGRGCTGSWTAAAPTAARPRSSGGAGGASCAWPTCPSTHLGSVRLTSTGSSSSWTTMRTLPRRHNHHARTSIGQY